MLVKADAVAARVAVVRIESFILTFDVLSV